MKLHQYFLQGIGLLLLAMLSSCATYPEKPFLQNSRLYSVAESQELLDRFIPAFIIEEADKDYNRIGTPVALTRKNLVEVSVDPDKATVYTDVQEFVSARSSYINLYYRVHFSKVPFGLLPFYLGAGENVGLLVVITLDQQTRPLLYTLVHTCGCYLAFIPTSHLPKQSWPKGWREGRQTVYGENLPTLLEFSSGSPQKTILHIRPATHRVKNVWLAGEKEMRAFSMIYMDRKPFSALENIELQDGATTSFYETSGSRQGYVKNSEKIWERLLISWWALDWRVGEDKKLGSDTNDGITFYTSLKPWAREESDMRNFPSFLRY